eukprot:m.126407 g.126407  ORF g.126407 m.126407 type:complete len:259 (-) comp9706_c2_seq2:538-1314(-)
MAGRGAFKPVDRKAPRNPKYANVKSRIDTGSSMTKQMERVEYQRTHFRKKPGEIFRRIKANTFAMLVLEVADAEEDIDLLEEQLDEAATFEPGLVAAAAAPAAAAAVPASPGYGRSADTASVYTAQSMQSSASSFASFVQGVGQLDIGKPEPVRAAPSTCPYLLLDVRDKDEFDNCRIVNARNFPHTLLSRSTNTFTGEIQSYINKEGRLIIIYDEDEKYAPHVATVFVQRGVDNVFLLSGGLFGGVAELRCNDVAGS